MVEVSSRSGDVVVNYFFFFTKFLQTSFQSWESNEPTNLSHDVLLNLDIEHPPFFSRFQRLIEITGTTPEDTQAARKRYRFYQDRGYEIRHHKLGAV